MRGSQRSRRFIRFASDEQKAACVCFCVAGDWGALASANAISSAARRSDPHHAAHPTTAKELTCPTCDGYFGCVGRRRCGAVRAAETAGVARQSRRVNGSKSVRYARPRTQHPTTHATNRQTLTQHLGEVRVVEVRVLIGEFLPFHLCPNHERVHRTADASLLDCFTAAAAAASTTTTATAATAADVRRHLRNECRSQRRR